MALKVLQALDNAKIQYYHFKAIIIAGMGLFSDSYDLFCIVPIMTLIGRINYPKCHLDRIQSDVSYEKELFKVPASITSVMIGFSLLGTVIGQLVFGWLGDHIGRRRNYGLTLMLMVVSSIGCGFSLSKLTSFVLITLGVFRFFLGIGIGGDYPLSATIMSEFANRRTRGAFIASVFSMQGFGILLSSVVTLAVCSIFNVASGKPPSPSESPPPNNIAYVPPEADLSWRLILMLGGIPSLLTFYWRMKMPETARFTALVDRNELQAIEDMAPVLKMSLSQIREDVEFIEPINTPSTLNDTSDDYPLFSREYFRRHGRDIFAASANWFLLDIVFYSLGIFQFYAFKHQSTRKINMNLYEDAIQVAKFQCIIAAGFTIPGYFATVYLIDKVGRVPIQFGGFFCMAVSLFTVAKVCPDNWDTKPNNGFLVLYGLTFFFSNFGPNTTTFIVPAELFPTRFRATCHGISGAFGKIGAVIGAVGFLWISRDRGDGGIGISNTLKILAGVCVLGMMVTYFFTRETNGRSLEENEKVDELTGVWLVRCLPRRPFARPTGRASSDNVEIQGVEAA